MTAKTSLTRSHYGELITNSQTSPEHRVMLSSAWNLVKLAGKKLPASYDTLSRDRKGRWGGSALHHELYDVTPTGSKALICCREVRGSKYGVRTMSKTYYLVTRHGKGAKVEEANKAIAAKAAKAAGPLVGYAIEVVTGKSLLPGKGLETRHGYKALTTDEAGELISVWDASPWPLGKVRIEAATADHSGGFYYYASLDQVLAAANSNQIFGDARDHRNLVIARVEVAGREYRHGDKRCATRIKPIEIVATVI